MAPRVEVAIHHHQQHVKKAPPGFAERGVFLRVTDTDITTPILTRLGLLTDSQEPIAYQINSGDIGNFHSLLFDKQKMVNDP